MSHRRSGSLRLAAALLLLGLASLAVLPPPTYLLWKLSIPVTEWGYLLALLAIPLLRGRRGYGAVRLAAGIGLVAAALLVWPLLRSIPVALRLDKTLAAAFGPATPRPVFGTPPLRETLEYAARADGPLRLDLYRPAPDPRPAPGVVVIHGGAWQAGDRTQLELLNPYLAARGYLVASIDYRLAPAHPFPAARDDVLEALAFLKRRAADFGLDAGRLVLLGRSAGGQLALLVAYSAADPAIRGVIAFYAPADLRWGYAHPSNPAIIDSCGMLDAFLGGPPERFAAAYDAAEPVGFVSAGSPPTLLIHGLRDPMVSPHHSERLDELLAAAGRPHLLLRLPWATHGCDYAFSGPCGRISTAAVEHFLAVVTGGTP
jgi:acetyl esterase/lipase